MLTIDLWLQYPAAYDKYRDHCLASTSTAPPHQLEGSTLLIPPQSSSAPDEDNSSSHWIACLFTSNGYGRKTKAKAGVSSPKAIIANTAAALQDLEEQLRQLRAENSHISEKNARVPGEVWSVRINSGSFHVPWEETKRSLQGGGMDMVVVRPQVEVNKNLDAQRGEKRHFAAVEKSKERSD